MYFGKKWFFYFKFDELTGRHRNRNSETRERAIGLKSHISDWVAEDKKIHIYEYSELFDCSQYIIAEDSKYDERKDEDDLWTACLQNQSNKSLKYLIRRGVHPNDRGILWIYASGGADRLKRLNAIDEYNFYFNKLYGFGSNFTFNEKRLSEIMYQHRCDHSLNVCCHSSLPDMNGFQCRSPFCPLTQLKEEFKQICYVDKEAYEKTKKAQFHCCLIDVVISRVMEILIYIRYEIDHCPMIYPMARTFLYFVTSEHHLYACLYALLTAPSIRYLDKTTIDSNISSSVLRYLARLYIRKRFSWKVVKHHCWLRDLYKHDQLKIVNRKRTLYNIAWNVVDWPAVLFYNLRFHHRVRLIDCFLVEGKKILYRAMLYFISQLAKKILHSNPRFKLRLTRLNLVKQLSQVISSCELPANQFIKKIGEIPLKTCDIHNAIQAFSDQVKDRTMATACPAPSIERKIYDETATYPCEVICKNEWIQIMSWLPPRTQLKSPHLLFSTEQHGVRLRTLYHYAEHHKETIIFIKTTNQEIIGAYLSAPLSERIAAGPKKRFFGCGETFVFTLRPQMKRYYWVVKESMLKQREAATQHHSRRTSKDAVFVGKHDDDYDSSVISSVFNRITDVRKRASSFIREFIPSTIRSSVNSMFGKNEVSSLSSNFCEPPQDAEFDPSRDPSPSPSTHSDSKDISEDSNYPNDLFIFADNKNIVIGGGENAAIMINEDLTTFYTARSTTFNNPQLTQSSHPKIVRVDVYGFDDGKLT